MPFCTGQLDADAYGCYRVLACCALCTATTFVGGIIAAPLYAALGSGARQKEVDGSRLYLTATAVVVDKRNFSCGCCFETTNRKTVPLEKIQDISLHTDACADCCGIVPSGTNTFRFAIETAGGSGPDSGPEVDIVALADPEGFR